MTIYALSTGPGISGIGIIRVSGEDTKKVIEVLHHSISKIENCRLGDPGEFTKLAFQNGKMNVLSRIIGPMSTMDEIEFINSKL